ncbi:MAG TPA: family 16 glycoside hydrolase [Humisphaera sp.]|jgi:hypothetical protein|nr:family 16 glycoside hydrolase [Humisphaera sp.]
MRPSAFLSIALIQFICFAHTKAELTEIHVDLRQPGHAVSRCLTGSCIEDVNHEIYGGIYSQMIFGESFQEPPMSQPVKGMIAYDGSWKVISDGVVDGGGGPGPKLLSDTIPITAGEVGIELFLPGNAAGNAGVIVRASGAAAGADNFDGYEISVDVARKMLRLGRHHHDFKLLKEVPCDVSPDRWITLNAKMTERTIEISVDGKRVLEAEDPRPLGAGTVGLRQWQRPARYRNLWMASADVHTVIPFEPSPPSPIAVSGMWRPVQTGTANLAALIEAAQPFIGTQSQRITFIHGTGDAGIENRGLNRQGMNFVKGQPYEGYIWVRAQQATKFFVGLESTYGSRRYAQASLSAQGGDTWRRYDFSLTPDTADTSGRFVISLASPGSIVVGHAFLQPGLWGRYKALPLRRDVVEGLIAQGVTVMRYGGSMVNAPEYRWKKMIGPRDRRPPYKGTWYPYSSNGWGIVDFLDLCEAAGFVGIPDLNVNESPQDLADFIEYANGPPSSTWGQRRAADGHPESYKLRYIELGNEERVDDAYYQKFAAIAQAIWAKDPDITLVVGDFAYDRPITDPMRFSGAASRITTLSAHRKILELAAQHNREVWFDVHLWTEGPAISPSVEALPTYIDALDTLAAGARHRVVVFELNANNHSQKRALANAAAIGRAQRDGRLPIITSANALQVDHQNDNGWDQGLLFLNNAATWSQPPGDLMRMISNSYQPTILDVQLSNPDPQLDVTAVVSEDRRIVILRVVNLSTSPHPCQIQLEGFTPINPDAQATELAAGLDATNTVDMPDQVKPRVFQWKHELNGTAAARYTFPPTSFTVLRIE